jgi:hypothetical protein
VEKRGGSCEEVKQKTQDQNEEMWKKKPTQLLNYDLLYTGKFFFKLNIELLTFR